ncbi:MAG: LuxR C-terminal-related transcriptional regulator [Bacillota bacterium]
MDKVQKYIVLSIGLYFGWLLSVPFNGPIMYACITSFEADISIPTIYIFSHALGLLVLGIMVKRAEHWRSLLLYGGGFSLALSLLVFFMPLIFWPFIYALIGFSSAMFVLGWSYPFTFGIDMKSRLKHMALTIIISNVIYVFLSIFLTILQLQLVYFIALLFLAGSFKVSMFLTRIDFQDIQKNNSKNNKREEIQVFPGVLIFITCLLIFGLYINGGFMYQVMYPSLIKYEDIAVFYRPLPYIAVLAVMWRYGNVLQKQLPVYMGVSFMGLAFISFSLLHNTLRGFFLIETLIQSSFAFLDLFFFTILGDISVINRSPIKTFGFGIAAMVGAILTGGLLGEQLMIIGERYHLFTAMFALSAIFLTFLIIPWMFNKIDAFYNSSKNEEANYPKTNMELFESVFGAHALTAREMEIVELLLQGFTNKQIAAQLYVSENTLKTHIKNIYYKLQVSTRRELMSIVLGNKENHPKG